MSELNLQKLSDEELMKILQDDGSERAFEILMHRYKNPLFNFIYRFINDYEMTADIVQESFIKVFRKRDSYKTIAKFSTWLYTIALNLAKTEHARRKKRRFLSIDDSGDREDGIDVQDTRPMPDAVVDGGIKEQFIQEALLKIPEVYREAVILRDIQEMSYEEIAEITGVNVGTVKSRINRGRAGLRELLRPVLEA